MSHVSKLVDLNRVKHDGFSNFLNPGGVWDTLTHFYMNLSGPELQCACKGFWDKFQGVNAGPRPDQVALIAALRELSLFASSYLLL